jgi:hypothetical protein
MNTVRLVSSSLPGRSYEATTTGTATQMFPTNNELNCQRHSVFLSMDNGR